MRREWGPRARRLTRGAVTVAAIGTLALAAWLGWVSVTVLPTHDPDHVAMWRKVALGLAAYGALSLATVGRGPRPAWIESVARIASVAACGAGATVVASMLQASPQRFEGYLLILGAWIFLHGVALLAHLATTGA